MVLAIVSVFRFLRSASAKNEIQKKMKYRCERLHLGYREFWESDIHLHNNFALLYGGLINAAGKHN